jgi:AcrR family transcriptional regulator
LIRCVAYYGDVIDDLSRSEVERIAHRARLRNADLGITGCLFYFGRHFVQVLEGHCDDVGRLYGTVISDARQPNVIGLIDNIVQKRAFSNWSLRFIRGGTSRPARDRERPPAPAPVAIFDVAETRAQASPDQRLISDFERLTSRHLRVMPQQERARQTVERLLDAVNRMISSSTTFDRLSLEAAAANAGVTQQSAYRYFANIDDLVRAAVRRMQAHWNARFLDFMVHQRFESETGIASAAVAFIARTYETQFGASDKLKREILRSYHDIEYDAAWTISDAVVRAIAGAGAPSLRIGVAEMTAGLVALWAVTKSLMLRDAAELARPAVQAMMAAIFLAALSGPPPADGDGFARLV